MLETEANLKRLSLIISESEEATTMLRQPQDFGASAHNSSSITSRDGSEIQSKKTIAGQNIGVIKSILTKML